MVVCRFVISASISSVRKANKRRAGIPNHSVRNANPPPMSVRQELIYRSGDFVADTDSGEAVTALSRPVAYRL
jgi:hypothetical protein